MSESQISEYSKVIIDHGWTVEPNHPNTVGRRRFMAATGVSEEQAKAILRELRGKAPAPPPPSKPKANSAAVSEDKFTGDSWQAVRVTSERAKTLEDVLRICGADPQVWRVKEWGRKQYEGFMKSEDGDPTVVPMWSITVKFERKVVELAIQDEIEKLKARAADYAPQYPAPKFGCAEEKGNMLVVSIADPHFGALIWGREAGFGDWDLGLAKDAYQQAILKLLARTNKHCVDRVVYIVGNDQMNADNRAGTTEHGTQQDMDGRYQKVWWTSSDCSIWAVEVFMTLAPRVDVVVVPGNHDPVSSFHLGDFLRAWFRNSPQVHVDNSPSPRKIIEHGVVMLMAEHGEKGKLEKYPATMSTQFPEVWGRTKYREALTAHRHVRTLIELPGAIVRIMPSLRPSCDWTSSMHFMGATRCAEALVYNDREGLIGTGSFSMLN